MKTRLKSSITLTTNYPITRLFPIDRHPSNFKVVIQNKEVSCSQLPGQSNQRKINLNSETHSIIANSMKAPKQEQ